MRSLAAYSLAAVLLAAASGASAQEGAGCSGFKWPIDREQAAFKAQDLPALQNGGQLPGVMKAAMLTLLLQDAVTFEVAPTHKPKSNPAYAGTFPVAPIASPGPYTITISDEAWIDVLQNGKLLRQTGFTGSKGCPDVRKSVRFNLAAGPATILISDAAKETLRIDILPPAKE